VSDSKKCTKQRDADVNKKLAKFFHHNALPFNLVKSDELANLVKVFAPLITNEEYMDAFRWKLMASTLVTTTFGMK